MSSVPPKPAPPLRRPDSEVTVLSALFSQADKPSTVFDREAMPHVHALYGAAMRLCRSRDDASDLVQETLFKAWRAVDSF